MTGLPDAARGLVLYVAGYGRSGTTLLDRVLERIPGTIGLGEVVHYFDVLARGEDPACSCGATFLRCPLWTAVTATMRPAMEAVGGPAAAAALVHRFESWAALWLPGRRGRQETAAYAHLQQAFAGAIMRHAPGGSILVDSSKTARQAANRPWALHGPAGLAVAMIHVVRDPRAVMWSSLRGSNRLLEAGAPAPAPVLGIRPALGYLTAHLAALRVGRRIAPRPVCVIDYEALVADPERTLARLAQRLGLPAPIAGEGTGVHHRFSGNRARLESRLVIRPDEEWRSRLAWRHRVVAEVLNGAVHAAVRRRARALDTAATGAAGAGKEAT